MISEEIKQFRQDYNLTQKELANKMKVDQSTIARWETGVRQLTSDQLHNFNDVVYSYKAKDFPSKSNELLEQEKALVVKTVNELLKIAYEHENILNKRATVKQVLSMLDERIKRGN